MRAILRTRGVGPDAEPPAAPAGPPPAGFELEPGRPDWWAEKASDEVYGGEEETGEEPDRAHAFEPQPGYWPRPHMPAAITRTRDRAEVAISPRTRAFLYNASAAGAGWFLGLYHQFAWALDDCGRSSIGGALVLGTAATGLIAHVWDRRTRHWWTGIAWCARIPLATAVLALALWAPAAP
ncbi:MAG: hypothetical protein HOY75_13300 [Streptomyces sp.]|nr:hypothetical protein [Streptomyces sp.]